MDSPGGYCHNFNNTMFMNRRSRTVVDRIVSCSFIEYSYYNFMS